MPNLKIIFHGLCSLVPRLPKSGTDFSAMTVLVPDVPNKVTITDQIPFRLAPGQEISATKNNHETFAHKAFLVVDGTSHKLTGQEIEIKIDNQPLSGNVIMLQNDTQGKEKSVKKIANLHDIYSDESGMEVDPKFLANTFPAGLVARLTLRGGQFAAYEATIDDSSTASMFPYVFHTKAGQPINPPYSPMIGTAIFSKQLTAQTKVTVKIGNTPVFDDKIGSGDLELMIHHMPPNRDELPMPPRGKVTDTDFSLLYKVAKAGKKFRLPETESPGGQRPPLLCGAAFFTPVN